MTEQKQVFDKRELKALFRELLKPFAATIPEIGNQENAFNDAIPYLHRIFIGNNDYDWKIKELLYEFEDQIDDATNKAAEARRVFVLLLKVYILLEYMNASYLFDNPFGPLCGKIDGLAAKVKLLSKLNQEGTTVIMVTHSQHDATYAGRIINLFDGQVVEGN